MLTRYFIIGLTLAALTALLNPTAGGVVASVVFGFMAGNFACSLVHRLPRGKSILENAPYCGTCAHPLSELDLLPVAGALLLHHKCRYCHTPFPTSHTWTEVLIGALFALCFLRFGFSQEYILVAGLGVFLVTLAAIEINDGIIMPQVAVVIGVLGALTRTLHDGEIYNFLQGGLTGLLIGAALWHKQIKCVGHRYTLPDGAKLLAAMGICLGAAHIWVGLAVAAAAYALLWALARALKWTRVPVSAAVGVATLAVLIAIF